jgi:hypothetical protein
MLDEQIEKKIEELTADQQRKVARLMMKNPLCRDSLNFLIVAYWWKYDGWAGEQNKAQYLTPATSIIRSRRLVVQKIRELDWNEEVARRLSARGRGEPLKDPYSEDSLVEEGD